MNKQIPFFVTTWIAACFLMLIFLVNVASTACAKEAIPPKPDDLIGVWIGFDNDELSFSRLDLRSDFTGFLARVSPNDTVLHQYGVFAYRVTKWSIDGWDFNVSLTAATPGAESIQMRGRYNGFSLHVELSGTSWTRNIVLEREMRETAANKETRAKIRELEKRAP